MIITGTFVTGISVSIRILFVHGDILRYFLTSSGFVTLKTNVDPTTGSGRKGKNRTLKPGRN